MRGRGNGGGRGDGRESESEGVNGGGAFGQATEGCPNVRVGPSICSNGCWPYAGDHAARVGPGSAAAAECVSSGSLTGGDVVSVEEHIADAKSQGKEAFGKGEYLAAIYFYGLVNV
ncbi:hypothetical protein PR202_ga11957 [Eleusine coracana subsp. coracana]|uniref:Uncharacterized protein n=1 Tax=Eleusine coracana subsp. coracana TaxID=191504 RepID=A0AAV5CAV1_ELECO|nr:hypothetical protein PR202_ga11957 [Eleusine coracana subsp. coracana]